MDQNLQTTSSVSLRLGKASNPMDSARQTGNTSPLRRVDLKTSESLRARRVKVEPGHNHGAGFKGLDRSRGGDSFQSFIIPSRNPNAEDAYAPKPNYSFANLRTNLNNTSRTSNQGNIQKVPQVLTKSGNVLATDTSPRRIGPSGLGKSFVLVENRLNTMQSPTQLNRSHYNQNLTERVSNNDESIQNILKQIKSSRGEKIGQQKAPTRFADEATFPVSKRKSPTFSNEESVEKYKVSVKGLGVKPKIPQFANFNQRDKAVESLKKKDINQ